jgi:hypothetical protein
MHVHGYIEIHAMMYRILLRHVLELSGITVLTAYCVLMCQGMKGLHVCARCCVQHIAVVLVEHISSMIGSDLYVVMRCAAIAAVVFIHIYESESVYTTNVGRKQYLFILQ